MGFGEITESVAYDVLHKLFNSVPDGGLGVKEMELIFGYVTPEFILEKHTMAEIKEKIDDAMSTPFVGDEVIYKGKKYVVVNVAQKPNYKSPFVYISRDSDDGFGIWWDSQIKKTGFNYGEMDEIYKELNRSDSDKDGT